MSATLLMSKPPKTFLRRRCGKTYTFDAQILRWRRFRKAKGVLKDSVTKKWAPKPRKEYFQ